MEFGRLEFFTGKIVIPFPDLSCSALLKSFRIATLSASNFENFEIKKCKIDFSFQAPEGDASVRCCE